MTTPTAPALMSAEEFLSWEEEGFELIDGVPHENPGGSISSWISGELMAAIQSALLSHPIGFAFPQGTGIAVWPGRPRHVRKPDAMFVRRDRLPGGKIPAGWLTVAPDLAVEVISPNEGAEHLNRKLADYRAAGIPLVWVIYPETRTAFVYRGEHADFIDSGGVLDGGDVLPGFQLKLPDLFASAGDLL